MSAFARISFGAAITLALAAGLPASAQDAQPGSPSGVTEPATGAAVGVSFERFMIPEGEGGVTLMTLHADGLRTRGGLGLDFALSAPPEALLAGAILGVADLGPAYSFPQKGSTILVRGGGTTIACACGEGSAPLLGAYAGVAALLPIGPRAGLRIDITPRVFLVEEPVITWTVGIGITSLPRALGVLTQQR